MPNFFYTKLDWNRYDWQNDASLREVKRRDDVFSWLDRFLVDYDLRWSGYLNYRDYIKKFPSDPIPS